MNGAWLGASVRRFWPVLLLTAALLAGCAEEKPVRLNRQGNEAFVAGDYQNALDRYRQAQVESPDEGTFTYNAGNALYRLGQFDRAVSESSRAAAAGSDDLRFRAYYALGNAYFRQQKLREARDAYKSALKLNPGDADAKFNLEVAQRLLDERQARQQASPSPAPSPTPPAAAGGQPSPPPGQAAGTPNPGVPGLGSPVPGGQPQPGQSPPSQAQPGQGQPGAPAGSPQPGQGQAPPSPPQAAQSGGPGQPSGPSSPGASPEPPTAAQLEGQLRDALAGFERGTSVEEALRVLDVLAQQQRLRQSQTPPPPANGQKDQ